MNTLRRHGDHRRRDPLVATPLMFRCLIRVVIGCLVAAMASASTPEAGSGNDPLPPRSGLEDLIVTTDSVLVAGSYVFDMVSVTNGATLTLEGYVEIDAASVSIDAGARVSADGTGYGSGQGPGGGGGDGYGGAGGGHGGRGGDGGLGQSGGSTYGSAVGPDQMGSGGGGPGGSGGSGGGAIVLDVTGAVTIDGVLSADGASASGQSGGGAGGTIRIDATTVSGTGELHANGGASGSTGGAAAGGGGGGGRIYLRSSVFDLTGPITATGGTGVAESGAAGTIGREDVSTGSFHAGATWRFQIDDSPFTFDHVVLATATAQLDSAVVITSQDLVIRDGSTLFTTGTETLGVQEIRVVSTSQVRGNVEIDVDELRVDATSSISADGHGYPAAQGPGAGSGGGYGGSGGGHGGRGGSGGLGFVGGARNGSATSPDDFGSGGGGPSSGGGRGGGRIRIIVADSLHVDGVVSAHGDGASGAQSGGGAGGTIFASTSYLSGSGLLAASGGASGPTGGAAAGGGGGGGRVLVEYVSSTFGGSLDVAGGTGVGEDGEDGTAAFHDLSLDALVTGHAWRFQESDSPFFADFVIIGGGSSAIADSGAVIGAGELTLSDGGQLHVSGDESLTADATYLTGGSTIAGNLRIFGTDLTIDATSSISAEKLGYARGAGPGAGQTPSPGGCGAGHGGRGGDALGLPGGLDYGIASAPLQWGSGGGGSGGAGGGAIQILLTGQLVVDGVISVDGGAAAGGSQDGGGSGGSIYVIADAVSGSGSLTANGGASGPVGGAAAGGGGGGGRIAIYYDTVLDVTGAIVADGGPGVGDDGDPGTIVLSQDPLAIYPTRGGRTGVITTIISGAFFAPGSTVRLQGPGSIEAASVDVVTSTYARATFQLLDDALGSYDVVVAAPDGTEIRLHDGFTIEEVEAPDPWIDVIGRSQTRTGFHETFTILYGNRGNVDALWVPITFDGIPLAAEWELRTELTYLEAEGHSIDWTTIPVDVDSLTTARFVPLLVSRIPAGHTGTIQFTVEVSQPITFRTWANPPLIRNLPSSLVGTAGQPGEECALALLQLSSAILDAVPGASCVSAATSYLMDNLQSYSLAFAEPTVLSGLQVFASQFLGAFSIAGPCLKEEVPYIGEIMTALKVTFAGIATVEECGPVFAALAEHYFPVEPAMARDPNAKYGPLGIGVPRYVRGLDPQRYVVMFENVEDATAAARDVVIADSLDATKADIGTFEVGPITIGERIVVPPPGLSFFETTVDLRPDLDVLVRVSGGLEVGSSRAIWRFRTLDPATGLPPADPLAGFLPPNLNPPEGEGSVTFSVGLVEGLVTGTQVTNDASIVFDTNDPILTDVWWNSLDVTEPSSEVQQLAFDQDTTSFVVNWSGSDGESGLRDFNVYVARSETDPSGGPFEAWLVNTSAVSDTFHADAGYIYAFYSTGRDSVGNREAAPSVPDAITQVLLDAGEVPGVPKVHALHASRPNPFHRHAVIRFDVAEAAPVRVAVFDVAGRLVRTLVDESTVPGWYATTWTGVTSSGSMAAAGVYFVEMEVAGRRFTRRLVHVR